MDSLTRPVIESRPLTDSDAQFAYQVFCLCHCAHLIDADVTDMEFDSPILKMQSRAREQSYLMNYPEAVRLVLSKGNTDVGTLWYQQEEDAFRLIDIAVLPEYQGQGVGESVLAWLKIQAAAASKSLLLHVAADNAVAIKLYHRLGFKPVSSDGVYRLYEYR